MPIENRNLEPGTRLVARYHKQSYYCYVKKGLDGSLRYLLEDGGEFKSLSSAGKGITGKSCNGWSFWSLVQEETASTLAPETAEDSLAEVQEEEPQEETLEEIPEEEEASEIEEQEQLKKGFFRTPNQKGIPEDQTRWYCPDCGESFLAPKDENPDICPKGHQPS